MEKKTNKLYRFYADFGRMGDLEGLFIATPQEIAVMHGEPLYFGEVLGKHSEVFFDFDTEEHVTVVDCPQEFVDDCEKYLGTRISGYDPRDYLPEEGWHEDDDWDVEHEDDK